MTLPVAQGRHDHDRRSRVHAQARKRFATIERTKFRQVDTRAYRRDACRVVTIVAHELRLERLAGHDELRRRALVEPARCRRIVDPGRDVSRAHDRRHAVQRGARERDQPRVGRAVRIDDVECRAALREPAPHRTQAGHLLRLDRQAIRGKSPRARRGQNLRGRRRQQVDPMAASRHAYHLGQDTQLLTSPAGRRLGVQDRKRSHAHDQDGA